MFENLFLFKPVFSCYLPQFFWIYFPKFKKKNFRFFSENCWEYSVPGDRWADWKYTLLPSSSFFNVFHFSFFFWLKIFVFGDSWVALEIHTSLFSSFLRETAKHGFHCFGKREKLAQGSLPEIKKRWKINEKCWNFKKGL